jgi:ATP-dependent RNA circularization protein (DNA/RNA ligase family)
MPDFFNFPHTPHLVWLGAGTPREDKVLGQDEVDSLLQGKLVVEEKVDGANLGFSICDAGKVVAQNRGQYLNKPYSGQFSRLDNWRSSRSELLVEKLGKHLILFGEWCAARHSLEYLKLPDWFVVFDVYDRKENKFWSTSRRDTLAKELSLPVVPELFSGTTTLQGLEDLLTNSRSNFRNGPPEGLIIRKQTTRWLDRRAKVVRSDFTQSIEEHWRSRPLEWNLLG